jgi:co-chaperonin GroES (HSP10)
MSVVAKKIQVRAIKDHVLVTDMEFGEMVSAGGIVIQSDNAKAHGVKPRWCRVYKVGPKQHNVKVGDWILVEHGRWTRKMKIDDGEGEKDIQRVDVAAIMVISPEKPTDFYIGTEVNNGDSMTIRPEDFMRNAS